jgi:NAD(P)-dependent dehydrogenase (short-subunit alcohol dehydrogenase family)
MLDHSTKRVPMKRIGQPEEVAKAIVWLLSEDSTYVNGHSLLIDGGFMA